MKSQAMLIHAKFFEGINRFYVRVIFCINNNIYVFVAEKKYIGKCQ